VEVKMASGSVVDKARSYTGVSISGLIGLCLLLSSCGDYRTAEKCGDTIKAGDKGSFITDPSGLAKDSSTGTVWYRCPGGKTFSNFRCKGETLFVSWDDATAYAEEFSKKSWRQMATANQQRDEIDS
jgi:hypothetical protein